MDTILDNDIKSFLWQYAAKACPDDVDLQRLMDACLEKLKVDEAYIRICEKNYEGLRCTHCSCTESGIDFKGMSWELTSMEKQRLVHYFGRNMLFDRPLGFLKDDENSSVITICIYDSDNMPYAFVTVADLHQTKREWSDEEQKAVKLVSNAVKQYIFQDNSSVVIKAQANQIDAYKEALDKSNLANAAKTRFLAAMSHDIRTPMNAIVGFATLAGTHIREKERVQDYLFRIMSSSNHMLSLINDILDMSRLETGRMMLEEEEYKIPEIIHHVVGIVQSDVIAKNLNFKLEAENIVHEQVICDRARLNQILLKLLSNAIKFTNPEGHISLRIVEKLGAPAGQADFEFYVKDDGIGISKEFMEHLYEPFAQEAGCEGEGVIQGAGLGLTIINRIVKLMNGTIQAHSSKNRGAEFVVKVSFKIPEQQYKSEPIPYLVGKTALVINDNFSNCRSIINILESMGMNAEWTMHGAEAVLKARMAHERQDDFQVFVVDSGVFDISCTDLATKLKQISPDQNDAITVLTAFQWDSINVASDDHVFDAMVYKPLFQSEFEECMREAVAVHNGAVTEYKDMDLLVEEFIGKRILLAEDNEMNQEIATAILEESGFFVELAANGQIALDKVINHPPGHYDLILMDIQMPIMDGYEATKQIRNLADPDLCNIPVIAMTADVFVEDRMKALESGMNDHLAKPIDVVKLTAVLKRLLFSDK